MKAAAKNRRTLAMLLSFVAVVMFGVGYGLVPFYNVMCKLTGVNDLASADQVANTQVDHSRLITVEFDANTHQLPWHFRPLQASLRVHPGELTQALFEVRNDRNYVVSGQAIPSYGPAVAAQYFKKIECFCFSRQTLNGNEVRRMPVVFLVDGKLPKDVKTITLSYTFFEIDGNRAASAAGSQAVGAAGA
jgi:cytochrome c oxidase assembly protein subunit 11